MLTVFYLLVKKEEEKGGGTNNNNNKTIMEPFRGTSTILNSWILHTYYYGFSVVSTLTCSTLKFLIHFKDFVLTVGISFGSFLR